MKRNTGFTLIELVVVIVILALLAVVAAPKFFDLSSEARIGVLNGMKGTLESGSTMINMQAIIANDTEGASSVTVGNIDILTYDGYPTGHWRDSMRYIPGLDDVAFSVRASDICEITWCGKGFQTRLPSGITTSRPVIIGKVFPKGYSYNDECGVYYINNRDGSRPFVGLETADC